MAKYVLFQVGTESYGIRIEKVVSIETLKPITRVPTEIRHLKGVMNLRGTVIPVIDLRQLLQEPHVENTTETRIIVLTDDDQKFGMIVDAAQNVLDIEDSALQPSTDSDIEYIHVYAMAKFEDKVLLLVDFDGVLVN